MNRHPSETDLALLSGGDLGAFSVFWVRLHVRSCEECQATVAEFQSLRQMLSEPEELDFDWTSMAADMRANIRLGLEAGACVGSVREPRQFNPRLTVAFASLFILAMSGFLLRQDPAAQRTPSPETGIATLTATSAGLELHEGTNSLTLLNHDGAVADQTVGAQGEIRARYVDSKTGSVTINNVYLDD